MRGDGASPEARGRAMRWPRRVYARRATPPRNLAFTGKSGPARLLCFLGLKRRRRCRPLGAARGYLFHRQALITATARCTRRTGPRIDSAAALHNHVSFNPGHGRDLTSMRSDPLTGRPRALYRREKLAAKRMERRLRGTFRDPGRYGA